MNIGTKFNIKH